MEPREPKSLELTKGAYTIKSTPLKSTYEGKTNIYINRPNLAPELIWELNFYIGHRNIEVSPKGDMLILFGNIYFGSLVRNSETETLIQIYLKGKAPKSFTYKELTKRNLSEDIKRWGILELGGGWVDLSEKLRLEKIDWANSKIVFQYEKSPLVIDF